MVRERISTPTKTHSGKLLGRAVSAAKAIASKAGELVSKKSREKSAIKSTPKTAGTAATQPVVQSAEAGIKNHGDQLASAVTAVAKPVRKNGSRTAAPVTGKKVQGSAAASKASGTKSATTMATKTAAKSSLKSAAKSATPAVKSTGKPASKASGKSKLDGKKTAATAGKNTMGAGSDKLAAKSGKSPRKNTDAAPLKDMPAEASKGSTLPRSRAMPQSGRGASDGMPETRMRTR